jgi:hypothetical protein
MRMCLDMLVVLVVLVTLCMNASMSYLDVHILQQKKNLYTIPALTVL